MKDPIRSRAASGEANVTMTSGECTMGLYLLLYGGPLRNNSFSNDNESVPVIGLDYISNTVSVLCWLNPITYGVVRTDMH